MNTDHLSDWEQEEYLLNQRTPEMMRHLADCTDCRHAVLQLESGITAYRIAAVEASAQSLATRPQRLLNHALRQRPAMFWRWSLVAALPLLLLLALLPLFREYQKPQRPVSSVSASISDDALLDQVDEQLSVAVPDSMESLTHLVSTQSTATGANVLRSKPIVQTN